jgi:hypothetical protein
MKDREHAEIPTELSAEQPEVASELTRPVLDLDVFLQIRDVIRSHYLWQWEEGDEATQDVMAEIPVLLHDDPRFRLVGDIEVEDHVFEVTLWLQDQMTYSLAAVDVTMLDALQIDLGKGTVLARELTRIGLEYHLITFGEGRARQFHINVIGPRMQQIRDLGRLVVSTIDTYSA